MGNTTIDLQVQKQFSRKYTHNLKILYSDQRCSITLIYKSLLVKRKINNKNRYPQEAFNNIVLYIWEISMFVHFKLLQFTYIQP